MEQGRRCGRIVNQTSHTRPHAFGSQKGARRSRPCGCRNDGFVIAGERGSSLWVPATPEKTKKAYRSRAKKGGVQHHGVSSRKRREGVVESKAGQPLQSEGRFLRLLVGVDERLGFDWLRCDHGVDPVKTKTKDSFNLWFFVRC